MRRRRRRVLRPCWGPSARAAARGSGGRAAGLAGRGALLLLSGGASPGQPPGPGLSLRPPRPRVRHLGLLLRWRRRTGRRALSRGAPGSRVPRRRQPSGRASRRGRRSPAALALIGDPPVRRWGAAGSEKVAARVPRGLQRAGSPGMSPRSGGAEIRLLQEPRSQVGKERRQETRGRRGAGSGGSRLKLHLESLDGAGNRPISQPGHLEIITDL